MRASIISTRVRGIFRSVNCGRGRHMSGVSTRGIRRGGTQGRKHHHGNEHSDAAMVSPPVPVLHRMRGAGLNLIVAKIG